MTISDVLMKVGIKKLNPSNKTHTITGEEYVMVNPKSVSYVKIYSENEVVLVMNNDDEIFLDEQFSKNISKSYGYLAK